MASSLKRYSNEGFTLLEVMIALTIMILSFASIFVIQDNSISATNRAREMNAVAMLAKNQMTELEYRTQGKTFEEVKKEDGGTFPAPYEKYRWTSKVNELNFPNLGLGGGGSQSKTGDSGMEELVAKTIFKHLSKSTREIKLTLYWKRGSGEMSYTISSLWVNFNQELLLGD